MSHFHQQRGEAPPGWTGGEADNARMVVDARLVEMRRLLDRMRPNSNAEALGALRAAFPDAPLSQRVAAISRFDQLR